ncbi:Hypothetical predicted protein [Octopus vulgaris]|uniref:Uncharacterized protein n=1 Tax=Octopus vulgaris TaxID=6645 RepID=A0AA36BYR0_OCTVU|nr:Hypothetical predicted protein [Octopus vulgaris]
MLRLIMIARTVFNATRPNNGNATRGNIIYPKIIRNSNEKGIMEFRLTSGRFSNEILISAVLKVYIKTKGKRRKRRIILHVCEKNKDGTFDEFATVRLRIKQKGWQEINLPFYLLKKLKQEPIKLHVECEKCNKKVRLILPKRRKSNKPKKMRALVPNGKRSPMIVINTRENLKHPFRKRNRRDITLPAELNGTFDEEEDIVDGYDNVYRVKSIKEENRANGSRSYTVRMESREEEEEDNDNDNDDLAANFSDSRIHVKGIELFVDSKTLRFERHLTAVSCKSEMPYCRRLTSP